MLVSAARSLECHVLPWCQSPLPFARGSRRPRPTGTHRLDLGGFVELLANEGLAQRVPYLAEQVRTLAHAHRALFGFSFTPSELRVPVRDLPWLLAGIRAGLLTRPVVLDSPHAEDVASLGLNPTQTMLRFRVERLMASGMHISSPQASLATWEMLRWPERDSLAETLAGDGHGALRDLPASYDGLAPTATIAQRVGARPRLLLVGRTTGPRRGPLLGARRDGTVRIVDPDAWPTAASVLDAGCRFLTPEAALLLAGAAGMRDGESSFLGCDGSVLLAALTPHARIATITSDEDGIQLGTADPWRVHAFDRFVAVSG
jgi:hypothetical protein